MKTLCISLETAKRLKAAGWKKPTAFVYFDSMLHSKCEQWNLLPSDTDKFRGDTQEDCYAPTAEEVLRELPEAINGKCLLIRRFNNTWRVSYGLGECAETEWGEESLSEAAAQMWLWCVEQGYVKPEVK